MQRPKILITGANGSLGRDVTATLIRKELGDITACTRNEFDMSVSKADVLQVLTDIQPDVIVNCGAYTNVDGAESHREEAMRINAETPGVIAEWISQDKNRFLIHISTDYVFDGSPENDCYAPDDATNPVNFYGHSKLEGEQAILQLAAEQSAVLRTSWLYGQKPQGFVSFLMKCLQEKKSARVVSDQIGTPTSTANLTDMILDVLSTRRTGLLHGTCTGSTSRFDQALFLCDCLDESPDLLQPVLTSELGLVAQRPLNTSMQSSFDCAVSWQDAMRTFIASSVCVAT